MPSFDLSLAILGGALLLLSLVSNTAAKRAFVSEPLASMLLGIVIGPVALGLIDPNTWGGGLLITEQAARLTLAIGLMGIALRLPPGYFRHHWRALALLLGVAMPAAAAISGALIHLTLGAALWPAMLVGAILTPTDPIVASSIVTGPIARQYLPVGLRHLLSAESGINDGLAYPLVLLPLMVIQAAAASASGVAAGAGPGGASGGAWWVGGIGGIVIHWALAVVLWQTLGAAVVGAAVGYGAGHLLRWAQHRQSISRTAYLGYTVVLSVFLLGLARVLGTDGILAVFLGGLGYDQAMGAERGELGEAVQEAVNRFFTMPIFMIFGMALPWAAWIDLGWPGLGLVVGLLLLRRPPVVILLGPLIRPLRTWVDAEFFGWFGPMGVAAIFYAAFAQRHLGGSRVWPIVSLIVAGSIVAHGATATVRSRIYGRHVRDPVLTQPRLRG